jgi:hypothetical protein
MADNDETLRAEKKRRLTAGDNNAALLVEGEKMDDVSKPNNASTTSVVAFI